MQVLQLCFLATIRHRFDTLKELSKHCITAQDDFKSDIIIAFYSGTVSELFDRTSDYISTHFSPRDENICCPLLPLWKRSKQLLDARCAKPEQTSTE